MGQERKNKRGIQCWMSVCSLPCTALGNHMSNQNKVCTELLCSDCTPCWDRGCKRLSQALHMCLQYSLHSCLLWRLPLPFHVYQQDIEWGQSGLQDSNPPEDMLSWLMDLGNKIQLGMFQAMLIHQDSNWD